MNEIRMHVERLFQGKVLTEETIELKEEIYGNLVARYEDYVASGMSQAEALEKTKASMTSVEGVLAGEASAPAASTAAESQPAAQAAAPQTAAAAQAPGAPQPAAGTQAAATPQPPATAEQPAAQTCAASADGRSWFARHRKPVIGLAIGVALVVVLGIVIAVAGEALDDDDDDYPATMATTQTAPGDDAGDAYDADDADAGAAAGDATSQDDAADSGSADGGTSASSSSSAASGTTPTQQLQADIDALAASDVAACASTKKLAKALPLSGYLGSVSTATGTATLAYANIPDACDDDTVEAAIALDVATLFAFDTSLDTIAVTTHESDDAEHDVDGYTFYRASVVGNLHSCGALDGNLDSGVYASESTWESFKAAVTAESAVELICETHEHDD